jgi:hypothetical protein
VHDPALQCGWVGARGKVCKIPTGGGLCHYHRQASTSVKKVRRQRKPKATPAMREAFNTHVSAALAALDRIERPST